MKKITILILFCLVTIVHAETIMMPDGRIVTCTESNGLITCL